MLKWSFRRLVPAWGLEEQKGKRKTQLTFVWHRLMEKFAGVAGLFLDGAIPWKGESAHALRSAKRRAAAEHAEEGHWISTKALLLVSVFLVGCRS